MLQTLPSGSFFDYVYMFIEEDLGGVIVSACHSVIKEKYQHGNETIKKGEISKCQKGGSHEARTKGRGGICLQKEKTKAAQENECPFNTNDYLDSK